MKHALPILNLAEATFTCTFGRGCEGICCKNGRPPVTPEEASRIAANLDKFLRHLRPEARAELERGEGFVSRRRATRGPLLRVVAGWCIFFNRGCILHKVGAEEGDKFLYKPTLCSLFPLDQDAKGRWYVRQHGYKGEEWDLFCLAPENSPVPAAKSLAEEIALAARLAAGGVVGGQGPGNGEAASR